MSTVGSLLYLKFSIFLILFEACAHQYDFDLADTEFTTVVKAREIECFFQYAKPPQTLRFEVRVVDAGFSKFDISKDMKISFYVFSPQKKTVLKETKKEMIVRKYKVVEPGDYEICLNNSFNKFSKKTVYFEVSIDMDSDEYRWTVINDMIEAGEKSDDMINNLKKTANNLRNDLESIKHYQDTFRAVEARDINNQEKNLAKVNAYSSIATFCMMLFGALHLYVLKNMFKPYNIFHK